MFEYFFYWFFCIIQFVLVYALFFYNHVFSFPLSEAV